MTSIMPQTGYEKADLAHLCGNSTREIVITRASFAAEGAHQLGRPADVRRWTRLAE